MSKLHEHSVLTFHKILISRRVLEREKTDKRKQNRPDPPEDFSLPVGLWPMVIAPGCRLGRLPL